MPRRPVDTERARREVKRMLCPKCDGSGRILKRLGGMEVSEPCPVCSEYLLPHAKDTDNA